MKNLLIPKFIDIFEYASTPIDNLRKIFNILLNGQVDLFEMMLNSVKDEISEEDYVNYNEEFVKEFEIYNDFTLKQLVFNENNWIENYKNFIISIKKSNISYIWLSDIINEENYKKIPFIPNNVNHLKFILFYINFKILNLDDKFIRDLIRKINCNYIVFYKNKIINKTRKNLILNDNTEEIGIIDSAVNLNYIKSNNIIDIVDNSLKFKTNLFFDGRINKNFPELLNLKFNNNNIYDNNFLKRIEKINSGKIALGIKLNPEYRNFKEVDFNSTYNGQVSIYGKINVSSVKSVKDIIQIFNKIKVLRLNFNNIKTLEDLFKFNIHKEFEKMENLEELYIYTQIPDRDEKREFKDLINEKRKNNNLKKIILLY